MTRAKLISDIELRLTRGKVSDDFEVPKRQIAFWIDEIRDAVVSEYLNEAVKRGAPVDPFYITREECKLIATEDVPCIEDEDDCWERKIATLSGTPLFLIGDEGMIHVTNNVGEEIHRVEHDDLNILRNMRLSRPSQSKLVYHREGQDLVIDGLSRNYGGRPKIRVAFVRSIRNWALADTDDYPLSDNLVPTLLDAVEEVAIRELAEEISFEDDINDGTQG